MFSMYLFLKKNRFRKKLHLNKMAFSLMFDWTSLFYTVLLVGYITIAIIIEGDFTNWSYNTTVFLDGIAMERIWSIMTVVPLAMLFRSFQFPGVLFSTAEYTLTVLPHKTSRIWLFVAMERWVKSLFMYTVIGIILFLFSPSSLSIIIVYVFLLFFINVIMTPVEWKFFQLHIIFKLIIFSLLIVLNILSIVFNSPIIGVSFLCLLIFTTIILYRNLFKEVDWKRVTAACDYKLWNMIIISRASRTSFKKDRQYSIWQRLSFWKKPFLYHGSSVYHRLWFIYFEKNIVVILQFFGAMLLMLFVLLYVKELLFFIGIAFMVHAFSSVAATMYSDRLTTGIVQVLPWDVYTYKRTYYKWIVYSGLILLLPFIVYAGIYFTYWVFVQIILICVAFQILFHAKLDKAIQRWDQEHTNVAWADIAGYGILVVIVFSYTYPMLLIVGVVIGIFSLFYMRRKI